MSPAHRPVRVLHTFPHRIGAARICTTAWHQAAGAAEAGADVLVMPASVHQPLPAAVRVRPTLAPGGMRIPYRALGRRRALALHDRIVARALPRLAPDIDVVHAWPQGARETLRVARRLGLPTVLERANAHTRFAYEVVQAECERLGVPLPANHEHAYNTEILRHEEEEFALADRLLCPSEFVAQTFLDRGFPPEKLVRHLYGYDPALFFPPSEPRSAGAPLTVLFVGVAAVRKGVHFALEAWLRSPASADGQLLIAGEFLPEYAASLSGMLEHPSVKALGHRTDIPELMRNSDVLVLPSIEEGFGLVCVEALASGCVPLISDACTDVCEHDVNALVHRVADVEELTRQFTALHQDRTMLQRLRDECLRTAPQYTWAEAGVRLVEAYEEVVADHAGRSPSLVS